ncbi:MAG: cell division protein FtsA [Candidatus Sumerlaeaceae bacterium]|jgi:cell division protein FtsA
MKKARGPVVAALDVGTTKIRALVANYTNDPRKGRQLRILGVGCVSSRGVKDALADDLDDLTEAICQAVESCEKHSETRLHHVYLGIAGNYVRCRNIVGKVPIKRSRTIRDSDIVQAINNALETHFPFSKEYVPLNYFIQGYRLGHGDHVSDPRGMTASSLEVFMHVVDVQWDRLQNLKKAVLRAKLGIADVIVQSYASALAVLDAEQRKAGTVLLDMGGGTTDIIVFHNGQPVFTGVYPYAGGIITHDIASVLHVSLEEAEKLKCECSLREFGHYRSLPLTVQNIYSKKEERADLPDIIQVVEARVEEILRDIRDLLEKEDIFSKYAPGGLVLTGGAASLNGLAEKAQSIFSTGHDFGKLGQLTVVVGKPRHIVSSGGLRIFDDPSFATVVGLAIYGLSGSSVSSGIPRQYTWSHRFRRFWHRLWGYDPDQ